MKEYRFVRMVNKNMYRQGLGFLSEKIKDSLCVGQEGSFFQGLGFWSWNEEALPTDCCLLANLFAFEKEGKMQAP